MSYVGKVLQPGETVVYQTKPHWLLYTPAFFFLVLAVILAGLSRQFGVDSQVNLFFIAAAVVAAFAFGFWLKAFIRRATTELAVTNRRVIFKRGLVQRHTVEMNMDKVESVDVDQSILGRLFGYGTVTVHGTGGGLEPFPNIDSPIEFRNHVTGA